MIGKDVWFDSLLVTQYSSDVLEEDHYYPFGLTLNINATNVQAQKNPYKYNGKELESSFGLEMYEYGNRNYDPQIGRFPTIDRYAEKYYSMNPYQYGGNNPISFIDVNGDSIKITIVENKKFVDYYYMKGNDGYGFYTLSTTKNEISNIEETVQNKYTGDDQFMNSTSEALGRISLGDEGKALVDDLMNNAKNTVTIGYAKENGTYPENKNIGVGWNPSLTIGGPDEQGATQRPAYIGLAHELGHVADLFNASPNSSNIWTTVSDNQGNYVNLTNSEISASHVENKIRAENGIPLRVLYTPLAENTRLIKAGTRESIYYLSNETTNYSRVKSNQGRYSYKKK